MMTPTAKKMIELITDIAKTNTTRASNGWIDYDRIAEITLEMVQRRAKTDADVKVLLKQLPAINPAEDEDPNVSWADDPREERQGEVRSKRLPVGDADGPGRMDVDDMGHPSPGERVC